MIESVFEGGVISKEFFFVGTGEIDNNKSVDETKCAGGDKAVHQERFGSRV